MPRIWNLPQKLMRKSLNSARVFIGWNSPKLRWFEVQGVIAMPPHAYIPGQNARHDEDWFDSVKATADEVIQAENLHETLAWKTGITYFDAGFFWECHEVLEAVWLRTPNPSDEREMVQAIIQLANARLKLLMGMPRATQRLCGMVREHLARCAPDRQILGTTAMVWEQKVVQTEKATFL